MPSGMPSKPVKYGNKVKAEGHCEEPVHYSTEQKSFLR